jgi:LmbE family N-acetylglucosaminyl deacetylase
VDGRRERGLRRLASLGLWPGRRLVVVSPHLDDAVMSLGATIASAATCDVQTLVVTVFANDPHEAGPAGAWDTRCGFVTAAEAAAVRRAEDRRACALLGADPVWLPFADSDHPLDATPEDLHAALRSIVHESDVVLVPGWPLHHPDHALLADTLLTREPLAATIGVYVEQPYAVSPPLRRPYVDRPAATPLPDGISAHAGHRLGQVLWRTSRHGAGAWQLKQHAISAYASQVGELGPALRSRIAAYELPRRGETIGWLVPEIVAPARRFGVVRAVELPHATLAESPSHRRRTSA